jgi:transposase
MVRKRRKFTQEFKTEAVQLVTAQGHSFAEAASRLGISESVLRRWKDKLTSEGEHAFPGNGKRSPIEEENRRLREENKQLRMERDILKKATAFFAKESK